MQENPKHLSGILNLGVFEFKCNQLAKIDLTLWRRRI